MNYDGPEESEAYFAETYERDLDDCEVNERLADDGTEERLIEMDSLRYTLIDIAYGRIEDAAVARIWEGAL